jgi:MFS transporter, Spinster family, sphingosine-1-phosphate transporter
VADRELRAGETALRPAHLALALLTALNLLNYFDRYLLSALLPRVQTALGLDNFQAGLTGSAFMVGYCVLSPVFGYLGDRGTRGRLIASSIGLWSVATSLSGAARGFLSLVGLRTAVGVGEAGYATIAPTLIDDLAPEGRTSRYLAVFYVALPFGAALGYGLGGVLEAAVGWRLAFALAGVPGLILALLALRLPEPARRPREAAGGYLRLLAMPAYLWTVGGYMAYTFALGGFAFWGPKYLVEHYGLPLGRADIGFGAITAATGLLGTALGGLLADRFPGRSYVRKQLGFSALCTAIAFPLGLLAVLTPEGQPLHFFVFMGLTELLLFASTAPINAALLRSVAPELRAGAMAASIFAIHVGGDMLSSPVVGFIADRSNLASGLLILPAAVLLAALLWLAGALRGQWHLVRGARDPSA